MFPRVRLVCPSLWPAISRFLVLDRRFSGASLCSRFSNFRFDVPETGSVCDRDRLAEPPIGRRDVELILFVIGRDRRLHLPTARTIAILPAPAADISTI